MSDQIQRRIHAANKYYRNQIQWAARQLGYKYERDCVIQITGQDVACYKMGKSALSKLDAPSLKAYRLSYQMLNCIAYNDAYIKHVTGYGLIVDCVLHCVDDHNDRRDIAAKIARLCKLDPQLAQAAIPE